MPNKTEPEQDIKGPLKGDFVPPPEIIEADERTDALPQQEDFWRPPVRFGSVPVEKEPLGWDRRRGFRKLFPLVSLPTQVVERVSFGHSQLEPNRLFWGDNLHVMRQLPSESIDLIYIDPPFFSGRQYNVIFGDKNELRSFSDIWEGGMPYYLIWLNARLYEMKRLLRKTGSIVVHCDWHAAHYIKVELDKVFGYDCFVNELIWCRSSSSAKKARGTASSFIRAHDTLLFYCRLIDQFTGVALNEFTGVAYSDRVLKSVRQDASGRAVYVRGGGSIGGKPLEAEVPVDVEGGMLARTFWTDIPILRHNSPDYIGYPTQKPERLLKRIIGAVTSEGDLVADFFCGGGTTVAVAQQLKRKWIACDQSRVAVAITADRICRVVEGLDNVLDKSGEANSEKRHTQQILLPVPDFTVEHWGIYEAERLSKMPVDQFSAFVIRAFGAVPDSTSPHIHGMKGAIPVWVGEPSQRSQVSAKDVEDFANAIRRTIRYQQDNLRDGIMLAWAFRPDAVKAAERLREMEQTELNFIRLEQVRIDSPSFREHIATLSTDHADYANFLTFVQPPKVEVGWKQISPRIYKFDVSETIVFNPGAVIINVQWDFNYEKRFSSTSGYSFIRGTKKEPVLQVQYEFLHTGKFRIACKVQDDMGGEGIWSGEVEVS